MNEPEQCRLPPPLGYKAEVSPDEASLAREQGLGFHWCSSNGTGFGWWQRINGVLKVNCSKKPHVTEKLLIFLSAGQRLLLRKLRACKRSEASLSQEPGRDLTQGVFNRRGLGELRIKGWYKQNAEHKRSLSLANQELPSPTPALGSKQQLCRCLARYVSFEMEKGEK